MNKVQLLCSVIVCYLVIPMNVLAETNQSDLLHLHIIPIHNTGIVQVQTGKQKDLTMKHEIQGNHLFVECFVNDFHFNEKKAGALHQEGEGHIRLYINDEHVDTLFEPAFLIEDMPSGEYEIKVVLVKNDYSPYEIEQSISITMS
ncbi:hypothetical protein N0O92_02825 [Alkalihalobacillus sp. MEB130]|uniref:hypothetical protein n=1 Tax=Alkalihalobacillus sp. MEB130 TaxID=2976704 RepID=UPI0028DEF481|nr:hypothetical protein [Alkalihalobacillus sp. MEB130]MDT8859151.1 hypothetical protein [Alkalihalobacillus sp. MEB130]